MLELKISRIDYESLINQIGEDEGRFLFWRGGVYIVTRDLEISSELEESISELLEPFGIGTRLEIVEGLEPNYALAVVRVLTGKTRPVDIQIID